MLGLMKLINFLTFPLFMFLLDLLTRCKIVPNTTWVDICCFPRETQRKLCVSSWKIFCKIHVKLKHACKVIA